MVPIIEIIGRAHKIIIAARIGERPIATSSPARIALNMRTSSFHHRLVSPGFRSTKGLVRDLLSPK